MKIRILTFVGICILFGSFVACGAPNLKNEDDEGILSSLAGTYSSSEDEKAATLDLYQKKDGTYEGEITIESEGENVLYFSFTGQRNNQTIKYEDGVMVKLSYDADGEFTEDVLFEESEGKISVKEDLLVWKDENEGSLEFLSGQ